MKRPPNIVFVFADEWRAQATGYNGDVNCETPNLDQLASESIQCSHAVAGSPVCCPYRASLMTGQYPLTHGVYINDVELAPDGMTMARAFKAHGYETAYIGKWHLYGSPDGHYSRRESYVPRSHQMGFDDWKGFECNHHYHTGGYYHNDDPNLHRWQGYEPFAQTEEAARYLSEHANSEHPFLLMLSWGPPHFPLDSAPDVYQQRYRDRAIKLRPNVPEEHRAQAEKDLRGYYAHIAALDEALRRLREALQKANLEDQTILIVTSDHGDMRGSQGLETKLFPWNESIRVPFLLRAPGLLDRAGVSCDVPLDAPDIMPTLLGLCDLPIPASVEGRDWSPYLRGTTETTGEEDAYLVMPVAFTELRRNGMLPYRGIFNRRYTYVRHSKGPWLLYDNLEDPYQMRNLVDHPEARSVQQAMESRLQTMMRTRNDHFEDERVYLEKDGLTHYVEVQTPCENPWTDPWS